MATPGAMKNWEAQARTNSVLAGSLKALEERVQDLSDLLEWCVHLAYSLPDGTIITPPYPSRFPGSVGRIQPIPFLLQRALAAAFGRETIVQLLLALRMRVG